MNLTINQTSNKPIFQKKYKPNFVVAELKNVKNTPCACCGNKIITTEQISKAFANITRPLKQIIDRGLMERWLDEPKIKKLFEDFIREYPKTSFDKIIESPDNYKRFSSVVDYDSEHKGHAMRNIITRSRQELKGSGTVMKRLSVLKPYLKGTKLEVFEQLEIYSRKYPRKRLAEILDIEEIAKFHSTKDLLQRAATKEKRDFYFDNISILLKKHSISDEQIECLKDQALEYFAAERYPSYKVFMIKKMYSEFCEQNNCKNITSKIFDEVDKMPTTFITVDSFLTYAHNRNFTDVQIVYSLLNPYEGSFEHIVPRSEQENDSIFNGIVLCRRCNQRRSSIPYVDFIQYHPQMPYNTQKQVDFFSNLIVNGELPEMYKNWPIKIARNLFEYTDGKINLDVTGYCKKMSNKAAKRIAQRDSAIEKMNEEKREKISRKKELLKELRDIDTSVSVMTNGMKLLQKENGIDSRIIGVSDDYINHGNSGKPKKEF